MLTKPISNGIYVGMKSLDQARFKICQSKLLHKMNTITIPNILGK